MYAFVGGGVAPPVSNFRKNVRCYSPSFLAVDKPDMARSLEMSDRLVVYGGWLRDLHSRFEAQQHLIFEIRNEVVGRVAHCGILEFSGEQGGMAYMPAWMMHNLALEDGSEAIFTLRSLPQITRLRLQPRDHTWAEAVPDPKAVLEEALRHFSAVTEDTALVVHYADQAFEFNVLEVQPENSSRAACLVGADVELLIEEPETEELAALAAVRDASAAAAAAEEEEAQGGPVRQDGHATGAAAFTGLQHPNGAAGAGSSGPLDMLGLGFAIGGGGGGPLLPLPSSSPALSGAPLPHRPGAHRPLHPNETERGVLPAPDSVAFFTLMLRHPGLAIQVTLESSPLPPGAGAVAGSSGGEPGKGGSGTPLLHPKAPGGGIPGLNLGGSGSGNRHSTGSGAAEVSMMQTRTRGRTASFGSTPGTPALLPASSSSAAAASGGAPGAGGMGSGSPSVPDGAAPPSSSSASTLAVGMPPPLALSPAAAGAAAVPAVRNPIGVLGLGASHSEADLWVSRTVSKPSRCSFTWAACGVEAKKTLTIHPSDLEYPPPNELGTQALYLAVTAFGGPVAFSLSLAAVEPAPSADGGSGLFSASPSTGNGGRAVTGAVPLRRSFNANGTGGAAGAAGQPPDADAASAPSHTAPAVMLSSSPSPDGPAPPAPAAPSTAECGNCGQSVPLRTMDMHANFCRRNNWRCPTCASVLRTTAKATHIHCPSCPVICATADARDKHAALSHDPAACELCGELLPPDLYSVHTAHDCPNRRVPCVYCKMALPHKDLGGHEVMCGGRTVPCELCGRLIARKRMERHEAVDHGVGDGSRFSGQTPMTPFVRAGSPGLLEAIPDFNLGGGGGGPGAGGSRSATPSADISATAAGERRGGGTGDLGAWDRSSPSPPGVPVTAGGGDRGAGSRGLWGPSPQPPFGSPLLPRTPQGDNAVACPSCHRVLPSLEDTHLHLMTECPNMGTRQHAALVGAMFGEEGGDVGAGGEAEPGGSGEDDEEGDVGGDARGRYRVEEDGEGLGPWGAGAALPPAPRSLPAAAAAAAASRWARLSSSSTSSAVGPDGALTVQESGTSAPQRSPQQWQCPCCPAGFPREDDVQVHLLTDCPTPWADSTASVRAIRRVGAPGFTQQPPQQQQEGEGGGTLAHGGEDGGVGAVDADAAEGDGEDDYFYDEMEEEDGEEEGRGETTLGAAAPAPDAGTADMDVSSSDADVAAASPAAPAPGAPAVMALPTQLQASGPSRFATLARQLGAGEEESDGEGDGRGAAPGPDAPAGLPLGAGSPPPAPFPVDAVFFGSGGHMGPVGGGGGPPLACPSCPASFGVLDSLHLHMLTECPAREANEALLFR